MTKTTARHGLTWLGVMILASSLLAGCSSDGSSNSSAAPNDGAGSANAGTSNTGGPDNAAPAPDLSPVTYSINTADEKLTWDNPISKMITEKTGVSMKYDVTTGDQFQKWDLWLAGGDYPDIVVLDAKYTQRYSEAGAIIDLSGLIDKYGPHIKEKFGDSYNLLKDDNGHIFSLYGVNMAQEASPDMMGNFIIQYEVLKDAGYPEIKTLDQLYDLIAAYAQKNPKIDGKPTIGFEAAMNSYMINNQFNNPIISAKGLPDHGNYQIDASGSVSYNPTTPEAKTYYQFLNKLYKNGLFDKEAFSSDDIKTKIAQGRVLAAYAPAWTMGDSEAALRADKHPERAYAHIPLYFDADTNDQSVAVTPTQGGNLQWTVSSKAKHPERIIQMIDYLFSDEGQILTQWGLEGEDYKVDNGKRALNPELTDKRKADADYDYKHGFKSVGTGNFYWFGVGHGAKLGDGDYATPVTKDYIVSTYDDATKEVLAKYGKEVWADFLPKATVIPGYLWQLTPPESTKVQAQKVEDAWRKDLPKTIMAKSDDEFEAAWTKMSSDFDKAGVKDLNAAYTKLWKDFNDKLAGK